jgi:hypothetical protein
VPSLDSIKDLVKNRAFMKGKKTPIIPAIAAIDITIL